MTINDTRTKSNTVIFNELQVGDVYQDEGGVICIKTSMHYKDGVPNMIYSVEDGEWETGYECRSGEVIKLNAEIIIS